MVPQENRIPWMKLVNGLLQKAEPGNQMFYKLENSWGFIGDYSPKDAGEWPDKV